MDESMPTLTTVFTPPPDCSGIVFKFEVAQSGFARFYRGVNRVNFECSPPGYADIYPNPDGYFAGPGICPSGYTTAFSSAFRSGLYVASQDVCCPRYICP